MYLSVEDTILVVCTHGARHAWARLGGICDVAELLNHDRSISWGRLVRSALQHNVERMLYLGLALARKFVGANIPEAILREIGADPTTMQLTDDVTSKILSADSEELGAVSFTRFLLRLRCGFADRTLYLMNFLFSPSLHDWDWVRIPHRLAFLYVFLRPLRFVFGKNGH